MQSLNGQTDPFNPLIKIRDRLADPLDGNMNLPSRPEG